MMTVELAFELFDLEGGFITFALKGGELGRFRPAMLTQLFAQRTEELLAVLVDIDDHKKPVAETFGLEPLFDHLKRRLLLANDQHRFLTTDGIGNDVDDGLAFARTRGSLDQQARSRTGPVNGEVLRGIAINHQVAVLFRGGGGRLRVCVRRRGRGRGGDAQNGFEPGSRGRKFAHAPQIFGHGLTGEFSVEKRRCRYQLTGPGFDRGIGRAEPAKLHTAAFCQRAEDVDHVAAADGRTRQHFLARLPQLGPDGGREQTFEGRIEADFFSFAVEHNGGWGHFQQRRRHFESDGPKQQRQLARLGRPAANLVPGVAKEQERESEHAAIKTRVAAKVGRLVNQAAQPFGQIRLAVGLGIERHGRLVPGKQMVEQSFGRPQAGAKLEKVDARRPFADREAGQRSAGNGTDDPLFETLEKIGDVLLLRRFQPIFARQRQQDRGLMQGYPALDPEGVGPGIELGAAAAGEPRRSPVDFVENLPARTLQELDGRRRIERNLAAPRQLFGFRDHRVERAKLMPTRRQKHDQVLVAQATSIQQRGQTGMIGIGVDPAQEVAFGFEVGPRAGQHGDPQAGFIELDAEHFGPLPHPSSPISQPQQPAFAAQAFELTAQLSGQDFVSFRRVGEQPGGRDDFAAHDQRQIGVEHHQDQGVAVILAQVFGREQSPYFGSEIQSAGFSRQPGGNTSAQGQLLGSLPVAAFRGRQGENLGTPQHAAGQRETFTILGEARVGLRAVLTSGRSLDVLTCQPGPHLGGRPATQGVADQESTQQEVDPGIQVSRNRATAGNHLQPEGLIVDAGETGAGRSQLQDDHAERPPVGGRTHGTHDGFGRGVAGEFEGCHRFEVEIREAGRTKTGDHEVDRIPRTNQDIARM